MSAASAPFSASKFSTLSMNDRSCPAANPDLFMNTPLPSNVIFAGAVEPRQHIEGELRVGVGNRDAPEGVKLVLALHRAVREHLDRDPFLAVDGLDAQRRT